MYVQLFCIYSDSRIRTSVLMLVWQILSPLGGSLNPAFILFYFVAAAFWFWFCDCLTAWMAQKIHTLRKNERLYNWKQRHQQYVRLAVLSTVKVGWRVLNLCKIHCHQHDDNLNVSPWDLHVSCHPEFSKISMAVCTSTMQIYSI